MRRIGKSVFMFLLVAGLFISPMAAGQAGAGWGQAAKTVGMDLVAPLAQHFGVPVAPVQALLGSGLTLEGAVQALLVAQASKKPVDEVGSMLESNDNDMDATAKALDVEPSVYADDKVAGVIEEVSGTQAKIEGSEAASGAAEAKDEAQGAAKDAKKGLGGLLRPRQ
jgi:hypothetical protein